MNVVIFIQTMIQKGSSLHRKISAAIFVASRQFVTYNKKLIKNNDNKNEVAKTYIPTRKNQQFCSALKPGLTLRRQLLRDAQLCG